MEQGPSREANSPSASQEITRIPWNSKVHSRFDKDTPFAPTLSHIKPIHAPIIIMNNILPSTRTSSKRFLHQNPVSTSHVLPSRKLFTVVLCNDGVWATQLQAASCIAFTFQTNNAIRTHVPFSYQVFMPPEFCWVTVELPSRWKEHRSDHRLTGEM